MTALCKAGYSLQVGILRGVYGGEKLNLRLTERWSSKRNYQLPVAILEGEIKLKKKDNVPLDSEIIYRMSTPKRLRAFAIVANVKTALMPMLVGVIYCERNGILSFHSDNILDLVSQNVLFLTESQCYALGSFVTLLSMILNRYLCLHPVRIYLEKNSTKFIAVYMDSIFPWRIRKHEFTTVHPSFKSFLFGKRRALIRNEFFKTPAHQYILCRNLSDDEQM